MSLQLLTAKLSLVCDNEQKIIKINIFISMFMVYAHAPVTKKSKSKLKFDGFKNAFSPIVIN